MLESRFPVVLEDFHIRRGSGGKGRWKAGDGTLRRVRFLKPMHVAILSGHRAVPNPGTQGGAPGELGRNSIRRDDGRIESSPAAPRPTSQWGRRSRSSRRRAGDGELRRPA